MSETQALASFVERIYQARDEIGFYAVLEVESDASVDEIKMSYLKLASKLHPDAHGASISEDYRSRLAAVFSLVVEARCTLSDPIRRAQYDKQTGD